MTREDRTDGGRTFSLTDPRVMDPDGELVSRSHLSDAEVEEVSRVLEAMRQWNEVERRSGEESRRYMKLGETDMRALRYLLATERHEIVATPGTIAAHLGVSAAAATKLLDRLEAGGHIARYPHPSDRRSTAIRITEETRRSARAHVGRSHAGRFDAIARLSPSDRAAALRFLQGLIDSAGTGLPFEEAATSSR